MGAGHTENVDVLVQGAGIAGLTLAIAMTRKGYTVRVVERARGLSEIGAGIWMAANPMQVFDRLGLAEKVLAAGWAIHRLTLQDYHGDILQVSDLSAVAQLFGFETVGLHRSMLRRVLFEELPANIVTFGTEVTNINSGADAVSVLLTDDSRITAKIVAGADGVHSRIRQLASLGGATRFSGSSSYRAIARSSNLLPPESTHDAFEIWGKGCRLGFSKISADDYYSYLTFDSEPNRIFPPTARRAHVESLFRNVFPKWIGLLESTQSDEILQTDIVDLKRLRPWSSHHIGLLGDAAHATTPNLGQGGAMAMEDAYSLTDAFEEVGLSGKAFELYEGRRRDKVDWTVSTSWNIGRICHLKNPVLRALRNMILRKALRNGGEKQIRKLYSLS